MPLRRGFRPIARGRGRQDDAMNPSGVSRNGVLFHSLKVSDLIRTACPDAPRVAIAAAGRRGSTIAFPGPPIAVEVV